MQRNHKVNNAINSRRRHDSSTEVQIELDPCPEWENSDFTDAQIYRQLCPLLTCMRIFGLYYRRHVDSRGRAHSEWVRVYCFIICALMVLNVLRSFTVYRVSDTFDHKLHQKLLFTIWSVECTVKVMVLLVYCHKQNGIPEFFRLWRSVCHNAKVDRLSLLMMKKYIILSWTFIIFNSVVFSLILVYVPVLKDIFLEVTWRDALDFRNHLPFKIGLAILAVLNSSASMFPVSLFVVFTVAIGKQLKKFSEELAVSITDEDFHGKIEEFRLQHQRLCAVVAVIDNIFSPMIASVFSANIPMFCLVLYTMVTSIEIHISLVFINLFWLCFILLQMTIVSVTAAWVSVKAHSPLDHIYSIRFSKTSNDVQLQMHMFLNKLTGTQIGLTAMSMFVVDRPTILTIAGMMVTYFVLLIQFKIPLTPAECLCNITGTAMFGNDTLQITQ